MIPRVDRQRGRRLTANCRRIKENLRPEQRHRPRGLREPLIPANSHANACELRVPDFEARVAGAEVTLLLVARPVGNVRLPVDAEIRPIRVDNRYGVEVRLARVLEEADRQHNTQLTRDRTEVTDSTILRDTACETQVPHILLDAKVRRLE